LTDVDIRAAAAPRSDQLNAEDLIGTTKTIRVAQVSAGSKEQPINVHYEGDNGKPWKPCKSMLRVLISAWGDKGADWVDRSVTLYADPDVMFGGVKVGGIRVSHISHIDQPLSVLLSTSRGKRKPYVVQPLQVVSNAAYEKLLQDIKAATDSDTLTKIVTAFDMDNLSEHQKTVARKLFVERKSSLNGETE